MGKRIKYWILIIAVLAVPVGTAVFSFSKIYETMAAPQLSIALVNEDKGSEFNGVPVYFGNAFIKEIERDTTYDWTVVSRGTAENGLANGSYDLAIIVPSDFSTKAIALDEISPEKVPVIFKVSPSANFMTDEYAKKAVGEVQATLNDKLIDMYFVSVLHNLQLAQTNVGAMVEAETEHNTVLHDEVAVNLDGIQKGTTAVEQQSTAQSSGLESHKKSADSLQGFAEKTNGEQQAFSVAFGDYAQTQSQRTDFASNLLQKDSVLNNAMQANTEISAIAANNAAILASLNDDLSAVEDLQGQTQAILDNVDAVVANTDPSGTQDKHPLWYEVQAAVGNALPKDGSLSGIPAAISARCAEMMSYDASDADLAAIQNVCQAGGFSATGRVRTLVGTAAPAMDLSGAFAALDSGASRYTITLTMPASNDVEPDDTSIEISGRKVKLSGVNNDGVITYTGRYSRIYGTSVSLDSFDGSLRSSGGDINANVSVSISDGAQTAAVGEFAVQFSPESTVNPTPDQLRSAYMLDGYFTVYYGATALDLVNGNGSGDLTAYLAAAQDAYANGLASRGQTIDTITNNAYAAFAAKMSQLSDSMTAYQVDLNAHHDAIVARIAEVQALGGLIDGFTATLEDWKAQKQVVNDDLTTLVADLQTDRETLVDLSADEAKLLQASETLVKTTTSQAASAGSLSEAAKRLAASSTALRSDTDSAVQSLDETIEANDESLEANTEYATSFNTVFDNSRIGERDNDDLYGFLAQPVVSKDMSRNVNGAQSLLPYFTVMLLGIAGFFTAYSFSTRKRKYEVGDLDAPSIMRQNVNQAVFLALFGLAEGCIIGAVGALTAQLTGTDLIAWILLAALSAVAIIWVCYALLKWLRSFGMLAIILVLFLYLVMNGVIGYGIEAGTGLALIQSFSPLWLLEGAFMRILFVLPDVFVVNIAVLVFVCGVALLAIVFVDWWRKEVHADA